MTNHQLLNQSMVHPMDDIASQARQGSVSAIIQVLNHKLASSGVRTRAVLADGVLQLLCEAPSVERLEQDPLVDRIRDILESLAPRNIRRVKINSRLVREQQLLWFDEINRDPQNQLLWSQQITLKKPNIIQQLIFDLKTRPKSRTNPAFPKPSSSRQVRESRQFRRGIVRGVGVSLLVVGVGFGLYNWSFFQSLFGSQHSAVNSPQTGEAGASPAPDPREEFFAQAVRLAEQASAEGKVAKTSAEWLAIAAKWQQASELMASVPSDHPRYKTAQNRTALYLQNSETAQAQAQRIRKENES
nr:hypothetical protein [Phormidium sp. CCY1219]